MSLEWVGMVFFAIGLILLWSAPERLLALQIIACQFAGSAALGLPALGGATVAPGLAMLLILFICVVKYGHLGSLFEAMNAPHAGFWLLMILVWSVVSATLMPRIFAGDISVIAMDRNAFSAGTQVPVIPLGPGSGNITQTAYVAGELFVFCTALVFLRLHNGLRTAARAMLWLAALNLLAAGIDLFGYYSGLGNLLEPLQTAGYAFMPEASFGSIKRINGTFSEASSFAGFTLPVLVFSYVLYREGLWRRFSGPVALGSLVALMLATSSTGYGGLGIYGLAVLVVSFLSGLRRDGRTYLWHYLGLALWGGVALTIALLALPDLREQAWTIFENTVLYKGETASALERGDWNLVSWEAFLGTWGLGAGQGSARGSSLPLVILSNLGLPGMLLFLCFIGKVLAGKLPEGIDPLHRKIVIAARHAVFAALATALISATVFDLGVMFYVLCAIACAPSLLYVSERPAPDRVLSARTERVAT